MFHVGFFNTFSTASCAMLSAGRSKKQNLLLNSTQSSRNNNLQCLRLFQLAHSVSFTPSAVPLSLAQLMMESLLMIKNRSSNLARASSVASMGKLVQGRTSIYMLDNIMKSFDLPDPVEPCNESRVAFQELLKTVPGLLALLKSLVKDG